MTTIPISPQAAPPRPPREPQPNAPWRAAWLLAAPHRLGFFAAALMLAASALWWCAVLLARACGLAPPWAVPPPAALKQPAIDLRRERAIDAILERSGFSREIGADALRFDEAEMVETAHGVGPAVPATKGKRCIVAGLPTEPPERTAGLPECCRAI